MSLQNKWFLYSLIIILNLLLVYSQEEAYIRRQDCVVEENEDFCPFVMERPNNLIKTNAYTYSIYGKFLYQIQNVPQIKKVVAVYLFKKKMIY